MANKLKKGEVIGLTNDQILREGIMVPFLEKNTNSTSCSDNVA